MGREAASVADLSAAVSYAVTVLTTKQDNTSKLVSRTATLLCKPGSSSSAAESDDITHGWRIAHTQRPTALSIVALAASHCGSRPSWANLGAPSSSVSEWLSMGAGGGKSKPWDLRTRSGAPAPGAGVEEAAPPARLVLLPLDPAASESALAIADAAAALLRPPQGAAAGSAPVIELGVASSRTGSGFITHDMPVGLGAEEDEDDLAKRQRDALIAAATTALAESGVAARAPFLAKSNSLTASGGAAPALLAVLQNPFHAAGVSGGDSGLPEQMLWWAPGDLMTLVTTTRAAIESARKAASAASGHTAPRSRAGGSAAASDAESPATTTTSSSSSSSTTTTTGSSTATIGSSSPSSSGLPASIAFSSVADVLASVLATSPEAPHRIAEHDVITSAKQFAAARATAAGVDPVAIDRAKRLQNPGGTFKGASASSIDGAAYEAEHPPAEAEAGAAEGSVAEATEFDPVSGWRNGLFHGRLRLRHQALAHASASLRARAAERRNSTTVASSGQTGSEQDEDALRAVLEARASDTTALPGRAKLGERGSLGLWAVMVCDPLSGPCRDAAAEWNALADAIAGPIRADSALGEPPSPSATMVQGGADGPLPEGATGVKALLAEAGAEVGYLRHWGVSLAAIDSTEPLAHPVLRGLGVSSAPSLLALSSEASPADARRLAVKLVNDTRDLQSLGLGMGSAMAALRKAMPYKPEMVGAGRANGRRDVTAAGAARWLASVVRSEAVNYVLEDDVHTITMSDDMKAAAKAFEDKMRRNAEQAASDKPDPQSIA